MMKLSSKILLYNLLAKGMILLAFLMLGPRLLHFFALKNTDRQLLEKQEQVLEIIRAEGMDPFFIEDDYSAGFGSYNILKEEYILLERIFEVVPLDTVYNEERIIEDELVKYRVRAFVFEFEEEYFLLEIGRSLETIHEIESIIFRILYVIVFIFLVATFFLDTAFSKALLKPFKQITEQKLTQIKEPHQFPYTPIQTTTAEFKLLDESISDMMRRIQKAFNREREFISHASHELKTPISILQTKIETLFGRENLDPKLMEKLMDMQETVQKMKKSVNALLMISKVNNAQFLKTEEINLAELLEELIEEWGPMLEEKGIALQAEIDDAGNIKGTNKSLCQMMVQNAFVNALKYTPDNGSITLNGTRKMGKYLISISNSGPGIDSEVMEQIRSGVVFLKDARKDRSGFGLQLIFKIATFLGVHVDLESEDNKTEVRFIFDQP